MGLLAEIFGSAGSAQQFFGGQWWMVGLFLIFILSVYFFARGFTAEAMGLFIFSAIILVTIDNLFTIPSEWIIIIIVLISFMIGMGLKNWLLK